jgi:hypothetical protein
LNGSFLFVDGETFHHLLGFDGSFFEFGLHVGQSDLHFFDGHIGAVQLVKTSFESFHLSGEFLSLLVQDLFVDAEKF